MSPADPFPRGGLLCLLGCLTFLAQSACAGLAGPATDPSATTRVSTTSVVIDGQPLALHLGAPSRPRAADVLVLYASGDGGWFGTAVDMFRLIGARGFYTVGFSARSLLRRRQGGAGAPGVAQLADDYRRILETAAAALDLPPERRIVLTGWSRGASLAVLVGSARHASPNLAGLIAIGLADRENLAAASDSDDEPEENGASAANAGLDMYALLSQVAPRRSAVIQATGDGYLHASRARELFGPDTDIRRFYEVTASNHRFKGGAEAFRASLGSALDWVAAVAPATVR